MGSHTCVEMAVKVNHRDGSVGTVDGAQQRQGDGVVASESDETGQRLAELGWALLLAISGRSAREELVVPFLDLLQCPSVVIAASGVSDALQNNLLSERRLTRSRGCRRSPAPWPSC